MHIMCIRTVNTVLYIREYVIHQYAGVKGQFCLFYSTAVGEGVAGGGKS